MEIDHELFNKGSLVYMMETRVFIRHSWEAPPVSGRFSFLGTES